MYETLLRKIAAMVIPEEETEFRANPDAVKEHAPDWHQFGIIEHSLKFLVAFATEARELFKNWGIENLTNKVLAETIDGRPKDLLLRIACVFHDIGKFDREFKIKDGERIPTHPNHEAKGEAMARENEQVKELIMRNFFLTEKQFDYVARCIGLHFELGKVRKAAKKTDLGYTMAFARDEACGQACREIVEMFPDFKFEIGLLFLCDGLAKTDIRIPAETDEKIEKGIEAAEKEIKKRNLNPKLIQAVAQRPVNMAVARAYFETVL